MLFRSNLYEAYLQDIDQKLDQDGGTDMTQADLTNFLAVARIQKPLERWDALPRMLDVDGYLSHLALEMFTSHTDGYAMNRNNYRLYHTRRPDGSILLRMGWIGRMRTQSYPSIRRGTASSPKPSCKRRRDAGSTRSVCASFSQTSSAWTS